MFHNSKEQNEKRFLALLIERRQNTIYTHQNFTCKILKKLSNFNLQAKTIVEFLFTCKKIWQFSICKQNNFCRFLFDRKKIVVFNFTCKVIK